MPMVRSTEACRCTACKPACLTSANAVEELRPFSHLDIPVIGQAYLMFRASLRGSFSPGVESSDVQLFSLDTIPWDEVMLGCAMHVPAGTLAPAG